MSFKHNIGKTDKYLRIALGIAMIIAGYYLGSWLWAIGGLIVFATGVVNWCLIYKILGISTCKTKEPSQ
ncbi:MAG TPA: DUF2892 domain-containing protein [Candidatus Yonathbacteria bacterium]|nr:DUF2892 domain-containing protein [Candidatus Yonathbacteria bacterium]